MSYVSHIAKFPARPVSPSKSANQSIGSGSSGILRSFGKPAKGNPVGLPKERDRFQQIRHPRMRVRVGWKWRNCVKNRRRGPASVPVEEVTGRCGRGPRAEVSSQTEEFPVNAAFLLVTTAWLAGADQPAPAVVQADPPAATSSCCGGGCGGGCGHGFLDKFRGLFHRDCCE